MAIEDFTTFTEVDPNSKITVTASRVTWAALHRDEDAYVYKDKTAGYFAGNFEHQFTLRITGMTNQGIAINGVWALTNLLDDLTGIEVASGDYLVLQIADKTRQINFAEFNGGTYYACSAYVLSDDTSYYLTIKRDETVGTYGALYCYIYSDVTRATLLDTLSLSLHDKIDFRYIHAVISRDANDNTTNTSGYTEALELISNISTPIVSTQKCSAVSDTTATGNGTIEDLGLGSVTQHGHCWATSIDPTTADSKTSNGAGSLGAFTSSITGLTPSVGYYVRAYATNSAGTSYGANVYFRAGLPTSQREIREIGITSNELHFIGTDGKEYKLTGTAV